MLVRTALILVAISLSACQHEQSFYGAAAPATTEVTKSFHPATATAAGIQDAISLASAAGGGVVELEAGAYSLPEPISIPSGVRLSGAGVATVLYPSVSGTSVILVNNASNWEVSDLAIDGGPLQRLNAITVNGGSDWLIDRVKIIRCGSMNQENPQDDGAYSGMGIAVSSTLGETLRGTIRDCQVSLIAGGGINNGDGIYIGSGVGTHDILIDRCYVSTCGRHCYAVADNGGVLPYDITMRNCTGMKSALCGIDFEDATRCLIEACQFYNCGNDQHFYNPAAFYGIGYRLLAGMATGNEPNQDITITGCRFQSCYFGVTFGATIGLTIRDCIFSLGAERDLLIGGGQSPQRFLLDGSQFLSTPANGISCMYRSGSDQMPMMVRRCVFAKQFYCSTSRLSYFEDCDFRMGVHFIGDQPGLATFTRCNTHGLTP